MLQLNAGPLEQLRLASLVKPGAQELPTAAPLQARSPPVSCS